MSSCPPILPPWRASRGREYEGTGRAGGPCPLIPSHCPSSSAPSAPPRSRLAARSWGVSALSTFVDLHTHTNVGSFDATTTKGDIGTLRRRLPALHGLALTEHVHRWGDDALAELPRDLLVFNEREFDTPEGHVVVLGAPSVTRTRSISALRDAVSASGGLMILAHPFRFYPSALSLLYPREWHEPGEWPAERLAEHPLFDLVDAVEGWNHRSTPAQNALAEACARVRGLPVVAGSDSHCPEDVGRYATEFDGDVRSLDQLIAAIRAGRCRPVELGPSGAYRPPGAAGSGGTGARR